MKDGLYMVSTSYFCAGFVIKHGRVDRCAPILKRNFNYWKNKAIFITK